MKISPMGNPGNTVGAPPADVGGTPSMSQRIRSMKMNVNRTPGRVEEPEPIAADVPPGAASMPVQAAPEQKLPISDPSSDTVPAASEEPQPLSPQLAALARERRALQVKERAVVEKEKALEQKLAQGGSGIPKEQLLTNPIGTLLELGLTWDQMTDAVLKHQQGHNPDVAALQKQIADLEQGIDKKLTDREQQQEQEALKAMEREANALTAQGDDFELVRETRSMPDVMRLIKETYHKTGEVLDVREALQLVEAELIEKATRLASLKKIQQKNAPPPVPQGRPIPQGGMRTLTNRDTASVPMSAKARAIAAFQGTLKK